MFVGPIQSWPPQEVIGAGIALLLALCWLIDAFNQLRGAGR